MEEVFQAAFSSANFIPTVLLCIVVIYWLFVILGALDMGFLDFDLDADYESDFEIELDVNAETEVEASSESGGASWLMTFLSWFNLGRVPFMVFVTAVTIPTWFISINVNHAFAIQTWWISLLLFIPILFVSMFIGKILTIPLVKLFDKLDSDGQESIDPVGKKCKLILSATPDKMGQAEIKVEGTTNLINVKTREGVTLSKGASALVIEKSDSGNFYFIVEYND